MSPRSKSWTTVGSFVLLHRNYQHRNYNLTAIYRIIGSHASVIYSMPMEFLENKNKKKQKKKKKPKKSKKRKRSEMESGDATSASIDKSFHHIEYPKRRRKNK
eukprot:377714_1